MSPGDSFPRGRSAPYQRVHVDLAPTVENITRVLVWIDFFYVFDQQYTDARLRLGLSTLRGVGTAVRAVDELSSQGIEATFQDAWPLIRATRLLYSSQDDLRPLEVASLIRTRSFEVSFGVAEVAEKVIDAVDPINRQRRKEETRHLAEMNRIEEAQAERSNFKAMVQDTIELCKQLVEIGAMTDEEMIYLVRSASLVKGR